MTSTPPIKITGAKGKPRPGSNAASEAPELKLKDVTKYVQNNFTLVCRAPEMPFLQTSRSNGNKYLSCQICDVSDAGCISRLAAFSDDAERLLKVIVPTHVLKLGNLRFNAIEKQFKGACTCPLEFRADRQTTVTLGDPIQDAVVVAPVSSGEVPPTTPRTTIADVLDRNVTEGEFQLTATVKSVSVLFTGKRSKRFLTLTQGDREIEVVLNDHAAERTDESIQGHIVHIGPLAIDVDDAEITMTSVSATAVVDLCKDLPDASGTPDPVSAIAVDALRDATEEADDDCVTESKTGDVRIKVEKGVAQKQDAATPQTPQDKKIPRKRDQQDVPTPSKKINLTK